MSVVYLPIIVPELPTGYCYPATPAELLAKFGQSVVQLSAGNFTLIVTSGSTPASTDRDKFWKKPNDYRLYEWNSSVGAWVAEHLYPAASPVRLWWTDTLVALRSFDGGDGTATAPAPAVGAMWEEDATYAAKFPLHAGTLPSGTVVAIGATGGEEKHALTEAENASHTHIIDWDAVSPANLILRNVAAGGTFNIGSGVDTQGGNLTAKTSGSGTAHNTMPPYVAGVWIKRSARQFYVG